MQHSMKQVIVHGKNILIHSAQEDHKSIVVSDKSNIRFGPLEDARAYWDL
jgi:hypothetical protein